MGGKITDRQRLFCEAYLVTFNGAEAARRAGYSHRSAVEIASRLLRSAHVQEYLAAPRAAMIAPLRMEQDDVRRILEGAVKTDRSAFAEVRRICCRFCHGADHLYQETPNERRMRKASYDSFQSQLLGKAGHGKPMAVMEPFDEMGGVGYDRRKDPHPDCPECSGFGEELALIKDTRHLPPEAKALYEGIDYKNGVPVVKIMGRDKALETLAKYHGLAAPKGGDDDGGRIYVNNDPDEDAPDGSLDVGDG